MGRLGKQKVEILRNTTLSRDSVNPLIFQKWPSTCKFQRIAKSVHHVFALQKFAGKLGLQTSLFIYFFEKY